MTKVGNFWQKKNFNMTRHHCNGCVHIYFLCIWLPKLCLVMLCSLMLLLNLWFCGLTELYLQNVS